MFRKQLKNIHVWQFESLNNHKNIIHFVTERHCGLSTGQCVGFNLRYKVKDLPENVIRNREILADNLNLRRKNFFYPDQCHTANIKEVDYKTTEADIIFTDALVTVKTGKLLCVTTADYVPDILFDPIKKALGIIHAGWRGLVAGIIPETIKRFKFSYKCNPQNISVCLGPSITAKHYEVGLDVIERVHDISGYENEIVKVENEPGKGFLDLCELTRYQLLTEGVLDKNIEVSGICTFECISDFYSARKEGFNTGRFCTGIMLIE